MAAEYVCYSMTSQKITHTIPMKSSQDGHANFNWTYILLD